MMFYCVIMEIVFAYIVIKSHTTTQRTSHDNDMWVEGMFLKSFSDYTIDTIKIAYKNRTSSNIIRLISCCSPVSIVVIDIITVCGFLCENLCSENGKIHTEMNWKFIYRISMIRLKCAIFFNKIYKLDWNANFPVNTLILTLVCISLGLLLDGSINNVF